MSPDLGFDSMEPGGSEGDNQQIRNHENNSNSKLNNSSEGGKPKRQMKTPFQLETLEKAYAGELSSIRELISL